MQSGNVLFLLLLAIGLFAALAYAVSGQSRFTSGEPISKEKARANAAAILQYTTAIKAEVQRLTTSGNCLLTEINFKNDFKRNNGTVFQTVTSAAPSDGSCNIFRPYGGGINQVIQPKIALDPSRYSNAGSQTPGTIYVQSYRMIGIGTDDLSSGNDVVLEVEWLNRETCIALNEMVGAVNPNGEPPEAIMSAGTAPGFNGNSSLNSATMTLETIDNVGQIEVCRGKPTTAIPAEYKFLHTLVIR